MKNGIVTLVGIVLCFDLVAGCAPPAEDDEQVLEDLVDEWADGDEDEDEVGDDEWRVVCAAEDACMYGCEFDNDYARRVYETSQSREHKYGCALDWEANENCEAYEACMLEE